MKNLKILLNLYVVAALVLLISPGAAEASTKSEFLAAARSIPQALINRGYRRMGRVDLGALIAKMDGVAIPVTVVPRVNFDVGGGNTRSSAYFFCSPGSKRITVGEDIWRATPPKARPVLALHEFLGCSGVNDKSYNVSNVLRLLSLEKTARVLSRAELSVLEDYAEQRLVARGGGVIGVGGGGDFGGAFLKLIILENNLDKMARARNARDREQAFAMLRFQLETGLEFKWKWTK